MRILICTNVYPPNFIGGAELVAHYQGKHLVDAGHEVQVFTGNHQPKKGKRHDLLTEKYDGLTVHRINLVGEDFQPTFVNFSHHRVEQHFTQLLENFRPDVVHCHNIIGLSVSILTIAKEFGAKVVLTLHDFWGFCFKNTIMKKDGVTCTDYTSCYECQPFIEDGDNRHIPIRMRQDYLKLAMMSVDAFVSPSQYLADTYIDAGFPRDKMHVVWNGIDVGKFDTIKRNLSNGVLRFSFFGHFGKHKGIHTLLNALELIKKPECIQINLIGEGDQRPFYEQQLQENGFSHVVRFWGKIENSQVGRAYAETDVLVLPSIWPENQPVSITEAMACGIPVLASDMGGMPELVVDGFNGFIFEAGNAADLAEKIDRLIADPVLAASLGKNGQKRINECTFARQVNKLLTIYRELVSSKPAKLNDEPHLIIGIGHNIDDISNDAIMLFDNYFDENKPRYVMAEWLTENQQKMASLAWVADNSLASADTNQILNYGMALVVPAKNVELVALCKKYNCGLYYRDADEAAACINHLIFNKNDRTALAKNASSGYLTQTTDQLPTVKE
jgi:glycosyltransferase involved in cell wall biosynthesis